ncbi:MAG: hypothetical protein KGZ84_00420 [Erysipelotrichia bacterium]|nr:hypothetical protein [Erysipelotrichia bacterium]
MFKREKHQESEFDYEEIKAKLKETEFEKGDLMALTIAALITIIPVMLLVLSIMIGVIWFIFIR